MRFLKKINKGLILTILVLVVLIVYLLQLEVQRNKEKPELEKICKDYIELINKYNTENNINLDDENKENEYKEQIKEDLKQYLIENKYVLDLQIDNLLYNTQEMNELKIKSRTRKIEKIKKYVFDGNEVTVTLKTSLEIEKYEESENGEEVINKKTHDTEDTITLTKVDDKWKITYVELQNPDEYQYNDMITEDF